MDLLYLDYNCFQRGFDDFRQARIQMEAIACQAILTQAENQTVHLIWSFMREDETSLCPFPERRDAVFSLASLCRVKIEPEEEIYQLAQDFLQRDQRFSARDAIHLACAVYAEAGFFLTCDDDLSKQAKRLLLNLKTMNPVEYIRRENQ